MSGERRSNAFVRLFRGETDFNFAGRWRWWFALSGAVILAGVISLGVRGLNFSIEFKGGTSWTVPTQTASLSDARDTVGNVSASLRQATIQILTDRQTGRREIEVQAAAKDTANNTEVTKVTQALADMAHTSTNEVIVNDVGPSWGSDITGKAIKAIIIFLVLCSLYIWLRFEAKVAVCALTALVHDIVVTAGIYSLSGFQVSPDTVIAFLTILGYSLYGSIVVFDRIQENTKGLASTGNMTYTETVNLSQNQVLARTINTSFAAILPILSILVIGSWILGATALNDFGLALFVGLTTGAYSCLFIASPLLALLKEREVRYAQIRDRLRPGGGGRRRLTPAAVAAGTSAVSDRAVSVARGGSPSASRRKASAAPSSERGGTGPRTVVTSPAGILASEDLVPPGDDALTRDSPSGDERGNGNGDPDGDVVAQVPARPGVPPRPRKKRRR